MPARLQLSRAGGFNLQAASLALNGLPAVSVSRPGAWGNMFEITKPAGGRWRVTGPGLRGAVDGICESEDAARDLAVRSFDGWCEAYEARDPENYRAWLEPLRDKNLACWCGQGVACHADVLLVRANRP